MLADQVGAVHLADGLFPQQAQPAIDLGDHPRDGGLARSGRPGEHQVVGALGDGQPALLPSDRHRHRAFQPGDLVFDLVEADELGELGLGLHQQVRLAVLGPGVDEVRFPGLGVGIPRIGARLDARGCGGREPERGVGEGLFDLRVLGICGVELLQQLAGVVVLALGTQGQRLGQRAVGRGDGQRAVGLFEVRQCGGEHAQPGQRDAEGHPGGVSARVVEVRVGDHRRQHPHHVGPALGPVVDGYAHPAGLQPPGPVFQQLADQTLGSREICCLAAGHGVGKGEVRRGRGTETQVETGVIAEAEGAGRHVDLTLQRAGGGRCLPNLLDHLRCHVSGGGQAGPCVALVGSHASQSTEPGSGGGQIRRSLPVVHRQSERATAGGEPADDVAVYPVRVTGDRRDGVTSNVHACVIRGAGWQSPGPAVSLVAYLCMAKLTFAEVSIA